MNEHLRLLEIFSELSIPDTNEISLISKRQNLIQQYHLICSQIQHGYSYQEKVSCLNLCYLFLKESYSDFKESDTSLEYKRYLKQIWALNFIITSSYLPSIQYFSEDVYEFYMNDDSKEANHILEKEFIQLCFINPQFYRLLSQESWFSSSRIVVELFHYLLSNFQKDKSQVPFLSERIYDQLLSDNNNNNTRLVLFLKSLVLHFLPRPGFHLVAEKVQARIRGHANSSCLFTDVLKTFSSKIEGIVCNIQAFQQNLKARFANFGSWFHIQDLLSIYHNTVLAGECVRNCLFNKPFSTKPCLTIYIASEPSKLQQIESLRAMLRHLQEYASRTVYFGEKASSSFFVWMEDFPTTIEIVMKENTNLQNHYIFLADGFKLFPLQLLYDSQLETIVATKDCIASLLTRTIQIESQSSISDMDSLSKIEQEDFTILFDENQNHLRKQYEMFKSNKKSFDTYFIPTSKLSKEQNKEYLKRTYGTKQIVNNYELLLMDFNSTTKHRLVDTSSNKTNKRTKTV